MVKKMGHESLIKFTMKSKTSKCRKLEKYKFLQ